MSKRNIAYVKPQEPSFLRKLKEEIGYKEGPTVETKRQALDVDEDDELIDEEPTVVVLKPGDLNAEEASRAKEQLEQEKAEAPADLNQRVIFKVPEKTSKSNSNSKGTKRTSAEKSNETKEKKSKSKPLLSFDDEENDDL